MPVASKATAAAETISIARGYDMPSVDEGQWSAIPLTRPDTAVKAKRIPPSLKYQAVTRSNFEGLCCFASAFAEEVVIAIMPVLLSNALVQLQARYNHCGEAASEKCLAAATFVRRQAPRSMIGKFARRFHFHSDGR
jgi:hypothetical protein